MTRQDVFDDKDVRDLEEVGNGIYTGGMGKYVDATGREVDDCYLFEEGLVSFGL